MVPTQNVKASFRKVFQYGMNACRSNAGQDDFGPCVRHTVGDLMKDIMQKHCHRGSGELLQKQDKRGTSESINVPNMSTNIDPWMTWFATCMMQGNVDVNVTKVASQATTNCTGGSSWDYRIEKKHYNRCAMKNLH